jgi:branched-subunit amino acid ABC-type transport system permease component
LKISQRSPLFRNEVTNPPPRLKGGRASPRKRFWAGRATNLNNMIFAQLFANGLIAGAIYSLVALGFSLIYSTCNFINFAHGVIVAVGAYFLYFFFTLLGLNFWISVVLTIIFTGLFGLLLNIIVFKELRRRKASNLILLTASFALLIIF